MVRPAFACPLCRSPIKSPPISVFQLGDCYQILENVRGSLGTTDLPGVITTSDKRPEQEYFGWDIFMLMSSTAPSVGECIVPEDDM